MIVELKDNEQVKCPDCQSTRLWKQGKSIIARKPAQKYLCRDCGRRFTVKENKD